MTAAVGGDDGGVLLSSSSLENQPNLGRGRVERLAKGDLPHLLGGAIVPILTVK